MDEELNLTIDELAEAVGVSVRTIRFYISEGLVPGAGSRGKSASYGEEHLLRLRLIRCLVERHVPLAEIGAQLAPLSLEEVRALLAQEERQSARLEETAQAPSPKAYISALLTQARAVREPSVTYCESRLEPFSPADAQPEAWERWELAPGVELHVREGAEERHRDLIRRLLREARRQ